MSEVHLYTLVTKNNLNSEQRQLFDLVRAAGIIIHPQLFKTVMDLLAQNIPPHALINLLRDLSSKIPCGEDVINQNTVQEGNMNDNL
ncbi:Mitotic-spindle organizing protein 2-like [Homarus americanus]|uniref:Mitotic-spindle organizing protein 2-like n=1 Tax=Homarus americanus TaxID=6706 RepID=A0A8J5TL72_HOMAM|nr:Mitotic-spindle organizing protein 2-like [Homarus americanus]